MNVFMTLPGQALPALFTDGRTMLAAGEDIQLVHYRQGEEASRSSLILHQHMISFVVHGYKQVHHARGGMTVGSGEGFFLSRGNYLGTERMGVDGSGYESLIIFLSDRWLKDFVAAADRGARAAAADAGARAAAADRGAAVRMQAPVFHFRKDVLLGPLIGQLLGYFDCAGSERARIEGLLPLKASELMTVLTGAAGNAGFGSMLAGLSLPPRDVLGELMEAHYREPLSLAQWAFLAGMSLSSFKRRFEAVYGMPPGKWIQGRRLREARQLLAQGAMNVSEVCYACGFENTAHFVQAFKDEFGVTPGRVRILSR